MVKALQSTRIGAKTYLDHLCPAIWESTWRALYKSKQGAKVEAKPNKAIYRNEASGGSINNGSLLPRDINRSHCLFKSLRYLFPSNDDQSKSHDAHSVQDTALLHVFIRERVKV